jgi:hypothetical protein
MSEHSAASPAGGSGRADAADATPDAASGDPAETVALDMAPTADAFDTMAAFDTAAPGHEGGAGQREAGADADEDEEGDGTGAPAAATALSRLLARLPGERRQWRVAGMVAGGILLGGLASGGVAWKMIGSRNAEVEARTMKLDLQSSRIAAQEAHIEVLTRAVKERPLPEEGANPDRSPQTSAPSDAAPSDAAPAPVPAPTSRTALPPRTRQQGRRRGTKPRPRGSRSWGSRGTNDSLAIASSGMGCET